MPLTKPQSKLKKLTTRLPKKTKRMPVAKPDNLFVRRPAVRDYQKAIDTWKEALERFGKKQLARAWQRSGPTSARAFDFEQRLKEIDRKALYAGSKGVSLLLGMARETRSDVERSRLLDIIENVRNAQRKIEAEATLERIWPDGSFAFSVQHDKIGWLEFDLLPGALPNDTRPGDRVRVRLQVDRTGGVISFQIRGDMGVIRGKEIGTPSSVPSAPTDWQDTAAVSKYREAMKQWDEESGLGRTTRPTVGR